MTRSRVTIRDVAAQAGVSHQTVSRVINGSHRVSPQTRERVEQAIARLGYRPNAIARSMAKGRTTMVGCLSPNLTDYTFASIIEGAQKEAQRHGYFLISAAAPDEETFQAFVDQMVSSRRIEGLLVINPYADGRFSLIPSDIPVVYAGSRPREEASISSVSLDDIGVAQEATEHLLEQGHRRIGTITGPMVEDCAQDRLQGFRNALLAANVEPDETLMLAGDWSAGSGHAGFRQWFEQGNLPTAVFAQNDQMAVGILKAAMESGIDVPTDLSIIGVDDIPMAAYFTPGLTTFRQDFDRTGRQAVQLLIAEIEDSDSEGLHFRLPGELILRHSTAVNHLTPQS